MSEDLAALRADIDDVDSQIVELMLRRQGTSRQIQALRRAGGGGPIDPAREERVLAGYETPLGATGRELAAAVLNCCRPAPAGS